MCLVLLGVLFTLDPIVFELIFDFITIVFDILSRLFFLLKCHVILFLVFKGSKLERLGHSNLILGTSRLDESIKLVWVAIFTTSRLELIIQVTEGVIRSLFWLESFHGLRLALLFLGQIFLPHLTE